MSSADSRPRGSWTRPSARRCSRRTGAPALAALLSLIAAGTAAADGGPAPPAIAADEIYLDLETRRFSAPIRAEPGAALKIAVHAPAGSQVVLAYWPTPDTCPAEADPASMPGVEQRAGAPRETAGGVQKYVIHVGPLRILDRYCFHASLSRRTPLSEQEQQQIDAAIDEAIRATMAPARDRGAACDRRRAAVGVRELGDAFERALGTWSSVLVVDPGTGEPAPIRAAFEDLIRSKPQVKQLVEAALQGAHNECSLREGLHAALAGLRRRVAAWSDGGRAAYDPLWGLDPLAIEAAPGQRVPFTDFLRSDDLKKRFRRAVLRNKDAFTRALWDAREALQDGEDGAPVRDPFPDEALERDFQSFLALPEPPPRFAITRADVLRVIDGVEDALARGGAKLEDVDAEVAKLRGLFPEAIADVAALRALPGIGRQSPDAKRLEDVMATQAALRELVRHLEQAEQDQAAFTDSAALALFRAQMQRVSRWSGKGEMQYAPTYVERFPLSVAADVGLGAVAFDHSRGDVFTYFGLAVYAAPVYKEEPLTGAGWRRKASFVFGITLNRPSLNSDAKVGGLLGGRMLLAGAGWRWRAGYLRTSLGALLYKQEAQNPLSSRARLRAGLYAGLSLDLDVIGTVTGWFAKAATAIE